jgi:hypothetical protein
VDHLPHEDIKIPQEEMPVHEDLDGEITLIANLWMGLKCSHVFV